jgi:uncharacterized phage protein gp47/JayE
MGSLTLKSENQILADQISKFLATTAINDLNSGSTILTLLEANAQEIFQAYIQLVNVIRNYNLDTTTGSDLDARAFEYNLTRNAAQKASGLIRILRDSSFVKVSTSFYSGLPAPVVGDTVLRVNDASNVLYGTSGTLIIGRGTSNEEEVTYTSAPTNFTNYYEFVTSPFANSHGLSESVILKQGVDEVIPAGTIVKVPAAGVSPDINFAVNQDVTLLSGEAYVDNVEVTAVLTGTSGNIAIGAITGTQAFASPPFQNAQATNLSKFTTGQDQEIDDDLRNRIKNHIQSLSNATQEALLNAIIGVVDTASAKRVVSANVILPTTADEPVKIYIDDGTGFEASFSSQGFESLIDQATGGETRLQLQLAPVVKASVESNSAEPFNMSTGNLILTYQVGLQTETITFFISDFTFPSTVKAQEIVSKINLRANLIEARTANGGTSVVISAKSDINEDIQVLGGTANAILNFPTDARSTLYLYVNGALLSKDGSTAYVDTGSQETYNFSGIGAAPWPLNVIVDGKSANPQIVNFQTSNFVLPSAATAEEVASVINAQLAGAQASVINNVSVRLVSNSKLNSGSGIQVTGGSANTVLNFPTNASVGTNNDYTLNRELGTIQLNNPLSKNDAVTAGSLLTRARLTASTAENYSVIAGQTLVITVDGGSPQTVTFPTTSLLSAAQAASIINASLQGGSATVNKIGNLNYLEINTNTYTQSLGSIEISSSSTAGAFGFTYDTLKTNQRPDRAFVVAPNSPPINFVQNQSLVVVVDQDSANKTFTIIFDFSGTVTTGISTTQFEAQAFNTVFSSDSILNNFYVIAKSGANTTSGSLSTVTKISGNTFQYTFASLPVDYSDFAIGDHVLISGMQNSANNGSFLITAINPTLGTFQILNPNGIIEANSMGTALIGQRRQVSAYTAMTGNITVSSPFRAMFSPGDTFTVLPSTILNLVNFINNKKVTTLSTTAYIEAVQNNTKLQLSSISQGSDGYIQVTGGSANQNLGFSTSTVRGLQAYNYSTGLVLQVHKTVYGDDQDLVSYPGVGAAGIEFQILAPTIAEVSFNLIVTLAQGVAIGTVENDIRSAVTGYVNSLGIGADVIVSTVIQKIMEVTGVTDVQIVAPTQNIAIADNEIARTSDSLITIG